MTFSLDEVRTIASRAFPDEPDLEIVGHNLRSHSDEKIGFLGDHRNLEITLRRNNNKQPELHRFFVKALPQSFADQSTFMRDHGLFEQESAFLNVMLPLLESSCPSAAKWCPKCYLANERVIVLEDLRELGYAMRDSKLFQGEDLRAAVRAQARLHAASLLAEARIGKSLREVCPRACQEIVFSDKQLEHKRLEMYTELAEKVAERRLGREHGGKLRAAFERGFANIHKPRSKIGMVVCHGDTWPNNSLFNDSSSPPSCVIVDFQLVRYAPRMYDVAQLVYLSTTREMRRREESEAIRAYHEELCETLRRNDPAVARPSLGEVRDEYEAMRLSALMASVMYYPIICLSSRELASHKSNEEEIYRKVMFRANNDYVLELCDREKEYGDRIADVVGEALDFCEDHAAELAGRVDRCSLDDDGES